MPHVFATTTKDDTLRCQQLIASEMDSIAILANLFPTDGWGDWLVLIVDPRDRTAIDILESCGAEPCDCIVTVLTTGVEEARAWFREAPELLAILGQRSLLTKCGFVQLLGARQQ